MAQELGRSNRAAQVMRWGARAVSSLMAAFWVVIGAAGAVSDGEPWTWKSAVMVPLIVSSALSVLLAWRWEGVGGALVLGCGIAHSLFAYLSAGRNRGLAITLAGGPLVIAGLLFLGSWRQRRAAE